MKKAKQPEITSEEQQKYNRFLRLPCRIHRMHVFHGIIQNNDTQTITCLSCGDVFEFHVEGRNKIEQSLWDKFQKEKDTIDLSPPPERRNRKRWNKKFLFFNGGK